MQELEDLHPRLIGLPDEVAYLLNQTHHTWNQIVPSKEILENMKIMHNLGRFMNWVKFTIHVSYLGYIMPMQWTVDEICSQSFRPIYIFCSLF